MNILGHSDRKERKTEGEEEEELLRDLLRFEQGKHLRFCLVRFD